MCGILRKEISVKVGAWLKTTKNRASNTNFLIFTNNNPREDRTKHSGNDEASSGLKRRMGTFLFGNLRTTGRGRFHII